ncbi:DUF1800 domain-containing protein [Nocardioides sp. GY 10127]|uniref:DUF1800 domain-containing protein n=1 Tax=Nocardioides sp. GY 10127 TaxID=2569762 RepID=UPI0010A81E45|nr:DUF1800 domain-containing protein [Nocardioides sp. GY 10127]TIC81569.1 DUF1800 domain-containing protein [Nocardioides sp. GY 10127]
MAQQATRSTSTVLAAGDRHLVGRFSYGHTPELARQVRAAGGARAWFDKQLKPGTVKDPGTGELLDWFPSLSRGPQDLFRRQKDGVEESWEVMADYQSWTLLRRTYSNRQVLEVMTEFWEDHLHVPTSADLTYTWRKRYGDVVRAKALGRFEDLLAAAVLHPAMLLFLDAANSTWEHPNENLARELLELHTVGLGHYGEDDVKQVSRMLTGYALDMYKSFEPSYRTTDHALGRVTVMGFTHPNNVADGRAATRDLLRYLARHPATAERLARKLVVRFVRDDAPASLVKELARVYLANDTDVRPVLRALVASEEFKAARGQKVRDAGHDVVATHRALDVRVTRPGSRTTGGAGQGWAAHTLPTQCQRLGLKPFDWPRPDGAPRTNDAWSSPSRLLGSAKNHWLMAGAYWPTRGVTYRRPESWLPQRRLPFAALVDHLSRELLGVPATRKSITACCQAADVSRDEVVHADHPVVSARLGFVLTTLLDSPAHLTH